MAGNERTTHRGGSNLRPKAILLCALALPFLIGFYALVRGYWARPLSSGTELRIDQYLGLLERGQVGSATILAADDRIIGTYGGGAGYWVPTTVGAQPLRRGSSFTDVRRYTGGDATYTPTTRLTRVV